MEYDNYRINLGETTGKAVLDNVNETIHLKEIFQKDKEVLEKQYSDLRIENEELKREKEKLQTEFNSAKSALEDIKAKFNTLQTQFQQVQNSLIKANEQISTLIARNQELCRKLEEKCGGC